MKVSPLLTAALLLMVTSATLAQQPGPAAPLNNDAGKAIFLFGRASYFRAIFTHRQCTGVDPAAIAAVDERLEKARSRLADKYGETAFPQGKGADTNVSPGICDAMTLQSYSAHVAEVEASLSTP